MWARDAPDCCSRDTDCAGRMAAPKSHTTGVRTGDVTRRDGPGLHRVDGVESAVRDRRRQRRERVCQCVDATRPDAGASVRQRRGLVPTAGIEPATYSLGNCRSIQLSYASSGRSVAGRLAETTPLRVSQGVTRVANSLLTRSWVLRGYYLGDLAHITDSCAGRGSDGL